MTDEELKAAQAVAALDQLQAFMAEFGGAINALWGWVAEAVAVIVPAIVRFYKQISRYFIGPYKVACKLGSRSLPIPAYPRVMWYAFRN